MQIKHFYDVLFVKGHKGNNQCTTSNEVKSRPGACQGPPNKNNATTQPALVRLFFSPLLPHSPPGREISVEPIPPPNSSSLLLPCGGPLKGAEGPRRCRAAAAPLAVEQRDSRHPLPQLLTSAGSLGCARRSGHSAEEKCCSPYRQGQGSTHTTATTAETAKR